YNTSQLLAYQDARLYLVGFSWDPDDKDEIRKRSPIELANETNPKNLLLFHGTDDDNVPFIHSVQFNATVNPHGNRTDYEFVVVDGGHHDIMNAQNIQKSIAWFDKYLKNESIQPQDVSLFSEPFPRSQVEGAFEIVLLLVVFSFIPLMLILQEVIVASWNALVRRFWPRRIETLGITTNYRKRSTFRRDDSGGEMRPSSDSTLDDKVKVLDVLVPLLIWFISCFIAGILLKDSHLSRVITFLGVPMLISFGLMLIVHVMNKKAKRGQKNRDTWCILSHANTLPLISSHYLKDLFLSSISVIGGWIILLKIYNALASQSLVHVEPVGTLIEANPDNPLSLGILFMYGIFILGMFVLSILYRKFFMRITKSKFDNYSKQFKEGKHRHLKRFFSWFILVVVYTIFMGVMVFFGVFFYSIFMPNPDLTGTSFQMKFNMAFMLALALVAMVTTIIQQILEQSLRSFNSSVLITALILLGFFINIVPRPF
ncbi:MAG: alpha/beta hydrolase family protein, partial [Promethearchaeota archaeon]